MDKTKLFLVIFFLAILVSFLLFILYNSQGSKDDITLLNIKENNILDRCGVVTENFSFCIYPPFGSASQIAWDENGISYGGKSVKLTFKDNNANHYLGIHLYLTLVLSPYREKAALEFRLKGKKNFPLVKNLNVYLKEGPIIQRMAKVSLPVTIKDDWQKFSISLDKFSPIREDNVNSNDKNEGFNWAVQEILFSIDSYNTGQPIELFIADLRIIDGDKIICELL